MNAIGPRGTELLDELMVHSLRGFPLTNYGIFLVIALILTLGFFLIASRRLTLIPKGIGNVAEMGMEFIRDNMVFDVIGAEGRPYLAFIASMFFFVLFNNLLGLIPGAKPGTGTMGTTVTWALIVFVTYNAIGMRKLGVWGYIKSFYPKGVFAPLAVYVMLLELISHFIRPLTMSIRLFANMFAGHVILGIFAIFTVLMWNGSAVGKVTAILPLAMQIAMYALEVFVAFIQAYVFAILTTVYINGAVHAGEH